jgi:ubiquinone biosynthesis protein COQ4
MSEAFPSAETRANVPCAPDGTPVFHPQRRKMKFRPLTAWRHFRILLKDKENTEEVFRIFEALPSFNIERRTREFTLSETGVKLRAAEPYLPQLLDDHASLRGMPEGSVAHAYVHFMESQGLSAQGLVDEYARFRSDRPRFNDLFEWYFNRFRDTHDLMHVLTGYSRDALGEQCVLAFSAGQNPGLGDLFIAYAGALHMRRHHAHGAPVVAAVREAHKAGKGRPTIAEMSISTLLAMPLEEARRAMGIAEPTIYKRCHAIWESQGIDPFDLLAPQSEALPA